MSILIAYLIASYIIGFAIWFIIWFLDKISQGIFIFGQARSVFNWYMLVSWLLSPIILIVLVMFILVDFLKRPR